MRWFHRAYAWLFGYFWLPCSLCGYEFSGKEWCKWGYAGRHFGVDAPTTYRCICNECADMGLAHIRDGLPIR
jgi:hypothetical protein